MFTRSRRGSDVDQTRVGGAQPPRYSNKEIARELLISAATVKKHTVSLYRKLHVGNRREALEKDQALDYLNE